MVSKMSYVATAVLLVLSLPASYTRIKCPKDDRCLCLPAAESEFHCPPNYKDRGGLNLHVSSDRNEILIDCFKWNLTQLKAFDVDLLPNITVTTINKFRMRFCPLPPNSFKSLLDKLALRDVTHLEFGRSVMEEFVLSKSLFEGLDKLQELSLGKNKHVILDDEVFKNTPNLVNIELAENNIELTGNLFKNTPSLKALDLSLNELESLPEGLFGPLKNLEILNLRNNKLTTIDQSMLEGLLHLKVVDVSFNNIDTISEQAFKSLSELTHINLEKNRVTRIPSNLFNGNLALKTVILASNLNLQLDDYSLANLLALEVVNLKSCTLGALPDNIFANSTNLKRLILAQNSLTDLSTSMFQGLPNLEEVHLEDNSIGNISNVFASLKKLGKIYLQNNLIGEIDQDTFESALNLEEVHLQQNRISFIHYLAFANLNHLKIINLSHNQIKEEELDGPRLLLQLILFDNNPNLEEIDLSYNNISEVGKIISLYNKVHLKILKLDHNHITRINIVLLQSISGKLDIWLDHNRITTVEFPSYLLNDREKLDSSANGRLTSVIHLANNPIDCDCHNYEFLRYFRGELPQKIKNLFDIKSDNLSCASPPQLANSPLASLSPAFMTCSVEEMVNNYTECPESCACIWRPFDTSVIINCSDQNLYTFPEIVLPSPQLGFNQTELHLENNNLVAGLDSNSTGYDNVTKLFLSHNNISEVLWVPPKLQVLRLENNNLRRLDYHVLNTLNSSSLVNLALDGNPWICDCDAGNLSHFLRQHAKQVDTTHIYCEDTEIRLRDLNRSDLCKEWQLIFLLLPFLFILLFSAVTVALYYRYQEELKIWLYAKNLCLWWVTEEDLDKDKVYDAFISYSHKDEDFVTQNLLPRLEGGPHPYKLCLHYRNWVPGEFIAKQVASSVLDSRRTLVVLSHNFLESVWGKMEFRTAHTQAMSEGRARVIILLYGDVDMNGLDSELKAYLKTNTYVKWGEQYFWNKLLYALPHSKRHISGMNQKHANVMNCIDDKFKLVAVTTPPDTISLEKPLTYVPSPLETPPAQALLV